MKQITNRRFTTLLLLALTVSFVSGCVYYNTMYHARRWFNQAESLRKQNNRDLAERQEISLYRDAIVKSSSILSNHPTSSWVDDALFIIGKSFYHLGENSRAERKFRELLSSFPESKYATESRFYLGKASFRLENYQLARETFTEFIAKSKKKDFRAEATYLMGEIAIAMGDTATTIEFFEQYLSEYEGSPYTQDVRFKIGELQFALENYAAAATAFRLSAETTKDPVMRYNALFERGRAFYRLDSIDAGLRLFRELEDEQQDSVKLGTILLRVAEGLKLRGSERRAILLCDEIGNEFAKRPEAAEAWFEIGVICQEDWSDLELAKEYFDLAGKIQRGGYARAKAIERAAEITKVETFRAKLNSESEEEASQSRFLLAELYRTTLNNPDSALSEYQDLVRTFPESGYAPKALLNIGYLYETHLEDSASASTFYAQVLTDYPRSDEVSSALKLLGDSAPEPNALYPDKLYRMAEEQHYDRKNLDSALTLYQRFMDEFPQSDLVPKADFAAAKIRLAQFIPSDSPPTDNPYRTADSLLAAEAAREDSIARAAADSMAAVGDSLKAANTPRVTATSDSDTAVTRVFSGDSTIVDTTGAMTDDIRLTDFIGSNNGNGPDEQTLQKINDPPKRDSLRQGAVASASDSAQITAPDSRVAEPMATDTTDDSTTPPSDNKRISLADFPEQQTETTADSLGAEKDSLTAKPADSISVAGDTLVAAADLFGLDSLAVDTTEVVVVDSSMIWLFQHLSQKYDGTDIGKEAARLARGEGVRRPTRNIQQPRQPQTPVVQADTTSEPTDTIPQDIFSAFQDTTGGGAEIEEALREEIDKWPLMQYEPLEIPEFDYPQEAATSKFKGRVTTKIKIDFNGRVIEVVLLKGTNQALLDLEVENTLLEAYFDPLKIEPLHLGSYFIYYYEIELPEVYR